MSTSTPRNYDILAADWFRPLAYRWVFVALIHLPFVLAYVAFFVWVSGWPVFDGGRWLPWVFASYIYLQTPDVIAPWLCARLLPRWPTRPDPPDPYSEFLRIQSPSKPRYTRPAA